jgi:hypothetical protein
MGRHGMVFAVVALAGGLLCQGCGPEIRDPTTGVEANYHWDTLEACLNRPIGEVYQAAKAVAHDLDLDVLREDQDGISAEIVALDAQRDQVDIKLGALPESRTELCIQIGPWGDKNKSIVLFEAILAGPAEPRSAPAVSRAPESTRPVSPSCQRPW